MLRDSRAAVEERDQREDSTEATLSVSRVKEMMSWVGTCETRCRDWRRWETEYLVGGEVGDDDVGELGDLLGQVRQALRPDAVQPGGGHGQRQGDAAEPGEDHQSGLSLRAKFNSGRTQKTPFSRCYGLTILQIKGVTFFKSFFFY